jgi:hypothetical protein
MAQVVLFHSASGLRQAEAGAAALLRAAGHEVITPGLCGGQAAGTLDAALALMGTLGWDLICARARQALEAVPGMAVLAGLWMGAGSSAAYGATAGRPPESCCCTGSRPSRPPAWPVTTPRRRPDLAARHGLPVRPVSDTHRTAVRCLMACRGRDRRRGAEPGILVSCIHLARPA